MKQSIVGKWLLICCLCLALLGGLVALSACSPDMGTPAPLGSPRNPYTFADSEKSCTAWRLVLQGDAHHPWCVSTLPAMHVGDFVRFGMNPQVLCITSIDGRRQVVEIS